ncbi:MAG: hypothetical protein WDN31_02195 [Hyphomicrobium sp.]
MERYEIRSLSPEHFLPGVAREARKLREDEGGDPAAPHVGEHPLGLRMRHDGFAAYGLKAIQFDDVPALGLGVCASTLFVMLGAFTANLILGRNANPNANIFGLI